LNEGEKAEKKRREAKSLGVQLQAVRRERRPNPAGRGGAGGPPAPSVSCKLGFRRMWRSVWTLRQREVRWW